VPCCQSRLAFGSGVLTQCGVQPLAHTIPPRAIPQQPGESRQGRRRPTTAAPEQSQTCQSWRSERRADDLRKRWIWRRESTRNDEKVPGDTREVLTASTRPRVK
jgi:hypothetical protein